MNKSGTETKNFVNKMSTRDFEAFIRDILPAKTVVVWSGWLFQTCPIKNGLVHAAYKLK